MGFSEGGHAKNLPEGVSAHDPAPRVFPHHHSSMLLLDMNTFVLS
jgi:hypothetical protein